MNGKNTIFRSLAMIEERIRERLTVEELAAGIHFSKYHYQRMFREAVGDSVMGYVARRKLALAAEELAGTDSTVLEIALKYGYGSHEGFTRSFKAYMGVTPAEYRKYQLSTHPKEVRKEKQAMRYAKATEEILRELNSLIVEAGETAAYTRKHKTDVPEAASYAMFWECAAGRAEKIAGQLRGALEQAASFGHCTDGQCPDGISARFLLIKAVEDAAFEAAVTDFHTGLTMARAIPEHQEVYAPLCEKYSKLARHARIKAEKMVDFLRELSTLIFQDMRQEAERKREEAAAAGRAAADALSLADLPYGYIAEEIREMAEELSEMPLEEITVDGLEDFLFRLETVSFAAETDILRMPAHRPLFDGIGELEDGIRQLLDFFRSLPEDPAESFASEGATAAPVRTEKKRFRDLAMQEGILLFYLKGELQKLGDAHLDAGQKASFKAVCSQLDRAAELAGRGAEGSEAEEVMELLREVYERMLAEADRLGQYGGPIRYLAEAVWAPVRNLPGYRYS